MSLMSGERQVYNQLHKIRNDHTARYYWAHSMLTNGDNVLDAMCGVGYGSYTMAFNGKVRIESFDIDEETIQYANKWYKLPNINYTCQRYQDMLYPEKSFDKVVSFEGIEHVEEPRELLKLFHRVMKDDGLLILSTPNGAKLKRDPIKHPEHFFHYLPEELESDLNQCGFKVEKFYSQHNKHSLKMNEDLEGIFMLCKARKV